MAKYTFALAVLLAGLTGCAAQIQVVPSTTRTYHATTHVEVLNAKPTQPFIVIAKFAGPPPQTCPASHPYCRLRKRAMALGADAIWIQAREVTDFPSQWIMIRGQLTHLYAHQNTQVRGVFLRYERTAK